jgi:integrase
MARPGRPASGRPYVCGPYQHRARHRLIIYTGRRPGPGSRRQSYRRSFDTREAALRWKRQFAKEIAASGRTIADAVKEYRDHQVKKGNKKSSIATSGYRLDAILDANMALADLTPRRAQDFYDDLVSEGGAVDTHHGCLVAAKAFGRFCHARSWLTSNPFQGVEPVGRKNRQKEQLRIDEARRFATHCFAAWNDGQDRDAVAALLGLMMNLRASEIANLTTRDVDDGGRVLWIAFGVDEETGEDLAKTRSSKRRAVVPTRLRGPMRALAATPETDKGHLWATERGGPADRHYVARHTRRLMEDAGVPVVTLHSLRGAYATLGAKAGETAEAIARELGHSDRGATAKAHYIDREEADAASAERVDAALRDDHKDGEPNAEE